MKKLIFAVIVALAVTGGTATFVNFGTQQAFASCDGGCN